VSDSPNRIHDANDRGKQQQLYRRDGFTSSESSLVVIGANGPEHLGSMAYYKQTIISFAGERFYGDSTARKTLKYAARRRGDDRE
jgi:hypothetical protein